MNCSFLSQQGKVALITGGSRGIGKSIALAFADAGADIAIAARKVDDLEKTAGEIKSMGRRVIYVQTHSKKKNTLKILLKKPWKLSGV